LLTRAEAAKWCRVSLAAFDAHVRPHVNVKKIGRRILVSRAELEAWVSTGSAKHEGAPPAPSKPKYGVSSLLQSLLDDPNVQATAARLQRTRRVE
jgi:hypothetical protein